MVGATAGELGSRRHQGAQEAQWRSKASRGTAKEDEHPGRGG
jgi:hypothetical protein